MEVTHKSGTLSSDYWPAPGDGKAGDNEKDDKKKDNKKKDEKKKDDKKKDDKKEKKFGKDFDAWIKSSTNRETEEGQTYDWYQR